MQMYDTQIFPIVNNGQLGNAVFPHLVQGIHDQSSFVDGLGVGCHDLRGLHLLNVGILHQHAAQIAIGNDAQQLSFLHHHSGTQTLVSHLDNDLSEVVIGFNFGTFIPDIQVFNAKIKLLAQCPARMEFGEVGSGKAPTPH